MARYTFRGGIHPSDGKELSKDKPIREVLPGELLVYPLSQHTGSPAIPLVRPGDRVKAGQRIAGADGPVSAHIHASVSGRVKAIERHRVPSGDLVQSILVVNDGLYEEAEYPEAKPLEQQSKEEILQAVREAGIVGLGGAGFPTHVKLSPKDPYRIDHVIANCAESEPFLTGGYRGMMEHPDLLIGGMKCVLKLFENAKGIIAIEDNKPDAVEFLTRLTRDEPRIEVYALHTKYPQGSERHLIYACTRRGINAKMLPADAGCIVLSGETLSAVHEAVTKHIPLMYRTVTVTGNAVRDPRNFRVRLGTNCRELIEEAGGFIEEPEAVIHGGPMTGRSLFDLDVPVTKTSQALICLREDISLRLEETSCIRCGRCVDVCPERLIPSELANCALHEDYEKFSRLFGEECVECGSCSYVCPAKRNLSQAIRTMKRLSREKAEAEAAAEKELSETEKGGEESWRMNRTD